MQFSRKKEQAAQKEETVLAPFRAFLWAMVSWSFGCGSAGLALVNGNRRA
jgi:hypothetical protein